MAKHKLTIKKRRELQRQREIDLLVTLDLDLMHSYNEEQKGLKIMELLPWWEHPPSLSTLRNWREKQGYMERREQLIRNEDLLEKVRYWASELFASGPDSAVAGYEEIVRAGPKAFKRMWLDAVRDVKAMAGVREKEVGVSERVLKFIEGLGVGIGRELAHSKIELQRQEDGTVIEGEVRVLSE